ncbi:PD40 domain-containing protein, partial [Candidatus Micrarchaeota archaeon]|nr:PD40 domain-containing protein [Candidatus Micrarchaeota archaeon]
PEDKIKSFEKRADGAIRITDCYPKSCQNPVFSPDSKEILLTRFLNGYNRGPSELVRINLRTGEEKIIVKAYGDAVNVPYGSWIDNKITFSSDINGKEQIFIANGDGSNITQITNDSENDFIEPVFNPRDTGKILFEVYIPDSGTHHIKLLEVSTSGDVYLTDDSGYDDRLPSWSPDGKQIAWQRSEIDKDSWSIFVAEIILEPEVKLLNIRNISRGPSDTDNSWGYAGEYILSSSLGDGKTPNIFTFSLDGKRTRITKSEKEDGAPSQSQDKKLIAFESHVNDEFSSSELWIIELEDS